jgi:hypothetical protein
MQGRAVLLKMLLNVLLIVLASATTYSSAEVYRWVDKDGKVHFTDKPPVETAENITRQVSKQNLDTSREEQIKLNQLHREAAAPQQTRQEPTAAQAYALATQCAAAKNRLRRISGNVIFIDDDGKVVKVTEKERQAKVAELKAQIEHNCL